MKFWWLAIVLVGGAYQAISGQGISASANPKIEKNRPIQIYDERNANQISTITESGRAFVEKEVRANEKKIKATGENSEFQCEEDSLVVVNSVAGSFTKSKSRQTAYLYQLCFTGQAQYATYLGGIIVVENNKTVAHYVYSGVSGFNDIRSLPDINRNVLSEIVLEFSHSINALNFAKSIAVYEMSSNKLSDLAEIEVFSRLPNEENQDIAYRIWVSTDKTPVFYQETYASEYQENKWQLKDGLKRIAVEKMRNSFTPKLIALLKDK